MQKITDFQVLGTFSLLAVDLTELNSLLSDIRNYTQDISAPILDVSKPAVQKSTTTSVNIISVTPIIDSLTVTSGSLALDKTITTAAGKSVEIDTVQLNNIKLSNSVSYLLVYDITANS